MEKERITIDLYILAFSLILFSVFLNNIKASKNSLHPIANSFSVLGGNSKEFIKAKYSVYGFLPYWSLENSKYIQIDKLTDIAYFSLSIEPNGKITRILDDGTEEPGYTYWRKSKALKDLVQKAKNNNVRVALTIISHQDDVSEKFLGCQSCWKTFMKELKTELNFQKITDVNLDFEHHELVDEAVADKYTQFIKFVKTELGNEYTDSSVVVSAFADSFVKPRITKPKEIAKYADGLFIMAYDFHQPSSENAGPVSPIGGAGVVQEYDIKTMLNDYMKNVSSSKLILGVPYYGYNWVVDSKEPNAKRIEGDDLIGFSQSQYYSNIVDTALDYNIEPSWDEIGQVPFFSYISNSTGSIRQVYYENPKSIKIKYDMAKDKNLRGVGIWALGYDKGYQDLWNLLGEEFPRTK